MKVEEEDWVGMEEEDGVLDEVEEKEDERRI